MKTDIYRPIHICYIHLYYTHLCIQLVMIHRLAALISHFSFNQHNDSRLEHHTNSSLSCSGKKMSRLHPSYSSSRERGNS